MEPDRLILATPSHSAQALVINRIAQPDSAVARRLDCAERELRVQFTRIAQLQAQLDLMAATLRRLS